MGRYLGDIVAPLRRWIEGVLRTERGGLAKSRDWLGRRKGSRWVRRRARI
jgi:hypothetical protein